MVWLWGLLLFAATPAVRAGSPDWQRDPVLSPLLIQQMVTDPTGLRWVATDEGVYRYDGYGLVSLQSLVRQGPRLRVELVTVLALDRKGHLWLGSESGLFRFDARSGQLMPVPLPLALDERPRVKALQHDPRTDRLWVGYGAGAVAVLAAAAPLHPLFPVRRVADTDFYFTLETGGSGAWLANDQATLYHLDARGAVCQRLQAPELLLPVAGTRPQRFYSHRALYALDSAGALRPVCRWPRALPEGSDRPYVTDSTLDVLAQGQWVHVSGVRGPRPRLRVTPAALSPDDNNTRNYSLDRDAYGNWWCFARTWRGCYRYRQAQALVQPLARAGGQPLSSTRLIARLPDGRLLVSTYGGAFTQAADSPTARLRPFPLWLRLPPQPQPYAAVFDAIHCDPSSRTAVVADELWGVARLDLKTGLVSNLAGGPVNQWSRLTNGPTRAYTLLADHGGRLWAGGHTGLFLLSPDRRALRRYQNNRPDWPLHKLDIVGLAEDPRDHALWVATNGGLFWLPPNQPGDLRVFAVAASPGRRLPTDALTAVRSAGPGQAWVGTRDQGLLLVDAQAGLVRQVSVNEGLPSHSLASVLPDGRGNLWLGTYAGLVRFTPGSEHLAVFGESEGLHDTELNRYSGLAEPDGTLWFGGTGGVFQWQPGLMTASLKRKPRLLLTELGLPAGASVSVRPLPAELVPSLQLAAGPNAFVELRLALTNFLPLSRPAIVTVCLRPIAGGAPPGSTPPGG
ncbi:hypothetical protein HER32_17485 [Hymenobacter sp. BT18]|uniref:ligand-binding sensor domain-containing protein n=1 Tax=Hymenobacter sp. BT18 TaxID=2835648 RepID=UPI00143E7927|nr:hypothetical protein [Hymenobacter sp. BT18]QIX62868.1 hypothetical protein HER32_17485 [Hymenobacter sp. BT18]